MIVKAYAKINLGLKVLGLLDNGYHNLLMYNSRIDLFDLIDVEKSTEDKIVMSKNLCKMEDNICFKTIQLIRKEFNIVNHYQIRIEKNIPSGAGLGGGSADAAAVLKAILDIESITISEEKLLSMATKLGADVPYCLFGSKAIVKGIGDVIEPTFGNDENLILLASPPLSFETKQIFKKIDKIDLKSNFSGKSEELKGLKDFIYQNDLEAPAKALYPIYQLDLIKKEMKDYGAIVSMMTGSGSSIIGIFDINQKEHVESCCHLLKAKFKDVSFQVCKTISY